MSSHIPVDTRATNQVLLCETKGLKLVSVKLHSCFFTFCVLFFFFFACARSTLSLSPRACLYMHVFVCKYETSAGFLLRFLCHTGAAAPFYLCRLKINLCRAWAQFSSLAACALLHLTVNVLAHLKCLTLCKCAAPNHFKPF